MNKVTILPLHDATKPQAIRNPKKDAVRMRLLRIQNFKCAGCMRNIYVNQAKKRFIGKDKLVVVCDYCTSKNSVGAAKLKSNLVILRAEWQESYRIWKLQNH